MLRYIRIALASVIFTFSLLFFLDFAELLSLKLHGLFQLQFIPALLSYSWIIVAVLILSVVLFGRVYCSVICPFGILQDIILWKKRIMLKIIGKKPKKKSYKPPYNIIRYGFLAGVIIPLFFGSTVMLTLTDPYSNFGRVCMGIFRPIYVWGNNIIASVLNNSGNYTLYAVPQNTSFALFGIAAVVLLILVVMVMTRGRLWCNTICPVGGLFGLISRYSIFKITISESKCVHCNKCTNACKSECIDHKNIKVDNSRCVTCFNCINKCDSNAINYKFRFCKEAVLPKEATVKKTDKEEVGDFDESRRRFIFGVASAVAVAPLVGVASTLGVKLLEKRVYPLPPGAVADFKNHCTGCQLCVSKCPMNLLRPSFMERGISGIMQPYMYFRPQSYCSLECTICSNVCPNGALEKLTVEQKKVRQVGVVEFVTTECVVYKFNNDCGACAEHCPTQAVKMVPYKDGLTIPEIDQTICIGCGACESICPMRPNAIFIMGLEPQKTANQPKVEEQKKVEVDGFGF